MSGRPSSHTSERVGEAHLHSVIVKYLSKEHNNRSLAKLEPGPPLYSLLDQHPSHTLYIEIRKVTFVCITLIIVPLLATGHSRIGNKSATAYSGIRRTAEFQIKACKGKGNV